jgi:hypothetical protein
MKRIALVLACLVSACASSLAANPNDPVDMAADLGNRASRYVGMGEVCDAAAGGGYRAAIEQTVESQQDLLGPLSGLVDRAYNGRASRELVTHMQSQMQAHNLSAAQFCTEVVRQADADLSQRTAYILMLGNGAPDTMMYARDIQRPHF